MKRKKKAQRQDKTFICLSNFSILNCAVCLLIVYTLSTAAASTRIRHEERERRDAKASSSRTEKWGNFGSCENQRSTTKASNVYLSQYFFSSTFPSRLSVHFPQSLSLPLSALVLLSFTSFTEKFLQCWESKQRERREKGDRATCGKIIHEAWQATERPVDVCACRASAREVLLFNEKKKYFSNFSILHNNSLCDNVRF